MQQIAFLGDLMLSGVQTGKPLIVSRRLKNELSRFDLRVATLETAVGRYEDIDFIKMPKSEVAVWSKPEDLQKLIDLKINVVSLANNHACDCGVNSMLKLIESLRNLGITPIGAGNDLEEAKMPAVYEKDGESIAIIACCQDNPKSLGTLHFATEKKGGIYKFDENIIKQHIHELKQQYTYVAVVVHWGIEHKWLPENDDVNLGKKMIDAGADMIIGGHPHHIQPVVTYKARPIFFSLGNFHFPDFCLDEFSNTYYPDEEELKQLPIFDWMAPDRRNFAMRYFWKYYGRLGIIASMKLSKNGIKAVKLFTIYKNGKVSMSLNRLLNALKLNLFSLFVGKKCSIRINQLITLVKNVVVYKILSLFIKRYSFFKYLSKNSR